MTSKHSSNNFSVQYLQEDELIQVKIWGDFDAKILSNSTALVAEELAYHDCNRILMDHSGARPFLSSTELADRPKAASILGIPKSSKIAIVYSNSEPVYKFIEKAGQSQAFDVKIFTDLNKAKGWLLDQI